MAKPIHVTDQTFEETINNTDSPVLVDFWAEWCGPCKMIAPVLEEIAVELEGKVVISKLNVDENPDTSMAYGVMSIPTLLLFKGGEAVDRIVGFQQKPQLLKRLEPHLS
jgi:thioredoxin 1